MIVFIPGALIASHIIDKMSLRWGITLGAMINFIGATTRVFPWPFQTITEGLPYSYIYIAIGQTICALAQTFVLAMPPKLAQNWFGDRERVTATAIGALANQLGIAAGFILSPSIVRDNGDNITDLLFFLAIISFIAFIFILIFFRSYPKAPPSISAGFEKENFSYYYIFSALCKQRSYVILLISFGIVTGCFYAISTVLNQTLFLLGYTGKVTAILGFLIVFVGLFGAFTCGFIADKTRKYKLLIIFFVLGSLLTSIFFTLFCQADQFYILIIVCSAMGFFMTGILPVCMDTSVEITYPLPEAITANLLMISAQLFGIIITLIMTYLLHLGNVLYSNSFFVLGLLLSSILVIFYRGENKRLNAEMAVNSPNLN